MLNHYIGTLNAEQEDRVLTSRLAPGGGDFCGAGTYLHPDGARCIQGAVRNARWADGAIRGYVMESRHGLTSWNHGTRSIETHFDRLCQRFGTARVANAIRERIWSNRARRVVGAVSSPGVVT